MSNFRRINAVWEVTPLVRPWLDHPHAPQRGEFLILNQHHPLWVTWHPDAAKLHITTAASAAPEEAAVSR